MSALRVLHVSPYSPAAWAYGGIPRVVEAVTEGLAARGHQVTLYTTDACTATTRLDDATVRSWHSRRERASGSWNWRVFPNVSNRAAFHLQAFAPIGFRTQLRRAARSFDIAHVHACHNLLAMTTSSALQRAGVPYVVMPNGTAPILERRFLAKRLLGQLGGWRVLHGAARVIAVSRAEVQQLESLGVSASRIARVPNPVATDGMPASPPRGSLRQRLGGIEDPIVLFLGKITPRKELPTLVRAFASLRDQRARLVIAGSDLGGLDEAMAVASALDVFGRVHCVGVLEGQQRVEALAGADVVSYATRDEVFGLVPCEALCAGTPVVVGDDCGSAQVIGETGGGLCVPAGDAAALTLALERILGNVEVWRERAVAAGAIVAAHFSTQTVAARLEDVYRAVLAPAPGRLV